MENKMGLKIKELREKQGWSQQQLADKIGVTVGSVGNYESGQNNPSLKTIGKLAKVFRVSTSYFTEDKLYIDTFADHFTVEEKEFLVKEEHRPWITLAKDFDAEGIDPEAVREALGVLIKIKLNKDKQ